MPTKVDVGCRGPRSGCQANCRKQCPHNNLTPDLRVKNQAICDGVCKEEFTVAPCTIGCRTAMMKINARDSEKKTGHIHRN